MLWQGAYSESHHIVFSLHLCDLSVIRLGSGTCMDNRILFTFFEHLSGVVIPYVYFINVTHLRS